MTPLSHNGVSWFCSSPSVLQGNNPGWENIEQQYLILFWALQHMAQMPLLCIGFILEIYDKLCECWTGNKDRLIKSQIFNKIKVKSMLSGGGGGVDDDDSFEW